MPEKIAVYGGSFDPPHKGHVLLYNQLMSICGAEKGFIIPACSSPFKNGCFADNNSRLKMCRLAFKDTNARISDIEIKRGGKSFTFDTITYIKEKHPDSVIYLFMGDDMFLSFKNWYKYEELLKLCIPVAASRTDNLKYLGTMKEYAKEVLNLKENEYIISGIKPFEISSTEIRRLIKENKDASRFLGRDVYSYILSEGLYK